jgi:hypothetical protein
MEREPMDSAVEVLLLLRKKGETLCRCCDGWRLTCADRQVTPHAAALVIANRPVSSRSLGRVVPGKDHLPGFPAEDAQSFRWSRNPKKEAADA